MKHPAPHSIPRLAGAVLLLALAGCGMKGPLRHPAPPPADAALTAPPTISPTSPAPSRP